MESKYRILRIIATILKVIAWIALVLSVLGGCGSLVVSLLGGANSGAGNAGLGVGLISGVILALGGILGGVIGFLIIYAYAELIDVLIALEANTRSTAEQLKNLAKT